MQYRILGRLEVERDGALVAVGGFQQRALLVMLLVARGRTVTLDAIVDELWVDDPPKAAVHTVRVYVSQLRKLLGEDVVQTRDRGYGLPTRPGDLDADVFEQRLEDARARSASGDAAAVESELRDALGLWHGPALAEFRELGFAATEAARLDELRLGAEEDLLDIKLAHGAFAVVIPRLEELRAAHPMRERVTAQLMTALYRSGRQADALAAYEQTRRALDEIGLQPGEELRRLQRRILQQDSTLTGAPSSPAASQPVAASRSRRWLIASLAVVVVAVVGAVVGFPRGGGSRAQANARHGPITLVLGGKATDVSGFSSDELTGLEDSGAKYHIPTHVAYGENFDAALARASTHSRLVLIGPDPYLGRMAKVTNAHPDTTYVLIGGSVHDAAFGRNVVGMPFDDNEVGYLGGYLSALLAGKHGHPSAVAGKRTPEVRHIVRGFKQGVQAAAPGMRAVVNYSTTFSYPPACQRIATEQINHGSTVVFDIAGYCGNGAMQAAGHLRAKGIGVDVDLSSLGPQIAASVVKHFDAAVELAVQLEVQHKLRPGNDVTLNVGNGNVDVVSIRPYVPSSVRERLNHLIMQMSSRDAASSS